MRRLRRKVMELGTTPAREIAQGVVESVTTLSDVFLFREEIPKYVRLIFRTGKVAAGIAVISPFILSSVYNAAKTIVSEVAVRFPDSGYHEEKLGDREIGNDSIERDHCRCLAFIAKTITVCPT